MRKCATIVLPAAMLNGAHEKFAGIFIAFECTLSCEMKINLLGGFANNLQNLNYKCHNKHFM